MTPPQVALRAGRLVVAAIFLLVTACAPTGIDAPVSGPGGRSGAGKTLHVVQKGETVYAIAWRYGLDYRKLADWNAIGPPYLIRPGQRLRIVPPATAGAPASSRTAQTRKATKPTQAKPAGTRPAASAKKRSETPARAPSSDAAARSTAGSTRKAAARPSSDPSGPVKQWRWPAKGRVTKPYGRSGNKGVDIAGRKGQPIKAAAEGRVVYSGGGLIGYGKLIILKHNKRYLSAYAHNNKLLVREGDRVRVGQRIAEMGSTGTERVMLHFEIRRDGKPVNPTLYLPKR